MNCENGPWHLWRVLSPLAVFIISCSAAHVAVAAPKLQFESGDNMGINPLPAERNRWKAHRIECPLTKAEAGRFALRGDLDFFTLEYGKPIAEFEFDIPACGTNFIWGAASDVSPAVSQAVRFGRGWCDLGNCRILLEMDVEVSGCTTEWQLVLHGRPESRSTRRVLAKFHVAVGAQRVSQEIMQFKPSKLMDGGVEIIVKGSDAKVMVHSLKIVPVEQRIAARRAFTLADRPWKAGVSFPYHANYVLEVNGKVAGRGKPIDAGGLAKVDITQWLSSGSNEVSVAFDGSCGEKWFAAEMYAVLGDGTVAFFPTDKTWEMSFAGSEWRPAKERQRMGLWKMRSGKSVAEGTVPLHAGPLSVRPAGTMWPVFLHGRSAAWDVEMPPGLEGSIVEATARNRDSGAVHQGRFEGCRVVFENLPVGAYLIDWRLLYEGRVVDSDATEMIVVGSLVLDEASYWELEEILRRRMRLISSVDCTTTPEDGTFIDHSGFFSSPRLNVGGVADEGGLSFRKTGDRILDMFSYKINVGTLGCPHILEVDYPDVREQALYACVNETFPVPFSNNRQPEGCRAWANASGCVLSGGIMPLSGGKKTMRIVFFPASRNITVTFETGLGGKSAGVCGFRVYEIEGSLPALRLPQTERIYCNHNERPLFYKWGASVNPTFNDISHEYREDFWYATYRALVNRIQFLKFAGHNASIEGVYMYNHQFKTDSGESRSMNPDFDVLVPTILMYAHNGIHPYLGFEYSASPALLRGGLSDVSDRDVACGVHTVSQVDRFGRQVLKQPFGFGVDFTDPAVFGSISNLLEEIHGRYAPLGCEGIAIVTDGLGWQPAYVKHRTPDDAQDFGYGDGMVSLFEREEGLNLNIDPLDPARFAKRHAVLTGSGLAPRWFGWRHRVRLRCLGRMADVVHRGSRPWRMFVMPQILNDKEVALPFTDIDSTREQRESYIGGLYADAGFGGADIGGAKGFEFVPTLKYMRNHEIFGYGPMTSRSARCLVRDADAVYFAPQGLNEHNRNDLKAADSWWWRTYGVSVFDAKFSGDNAMYDCVGQCAEFVPKTLFHTWLDVNCTTAFAEEERRFLTGFYAAPVGEYRTHTGVRGITAKVSGDALLLVNDTPYVVKGRMVSANPMRDALTGREFNGSFEYTFGAYGMTVMRGESPSGVSGEFLFDEDISSALKKLCAKLLKSGGVKVPSADSEYELVRKMRRFDVLEPMQRLLSSERHKSNQERFLGELKKNGVARIDLGSDRETVDEIGRLWLADQQYSGIGCYGRVRLSSCDRGKVAIANTDTPEIYRTELSTSGAPGRYCIPVPKGKYRITLHIADCWHKDPGCVMRYSVNGREVSCDPVSEFGRAGAGQKTFSPVATDSKGLITLLITNGIVNGIEVERLKSLDVGLNPDFQMNK